MKNQDTIGRALLAMFAFAVLANCAKADIESAQEHQGTGRVVIHDPEAEMGHGNPLFKWMIVSPDGSKAFANDFTTNAISVVTEDGTNYYAHVQGENNDRTKVIHFTVDKDGFPSSQGDLIDTTLSGEPDNQEKMKDRTLVGISCGYLHFNSNVDYWMYNPKIKDMFLENYPRQCLATYQSNSSFYSIVYSSVVFHGVSFTGVDFRNYSGTNSNTQDWSDAYEGGTSMTVLDKGYLGDMNGRVYSQYGDLCAELPGPISGLSNNGEEIFATTGSTNAFYNVTFEGYNVVKDENGHLKSMVPPTKEGLLRVIDNRKKGGKFLYVTRKGILSIEE